MALYAGLLVNPMECPFHNVLEFRGSAMSQTYRHRTDHMFSNTGFWVGLSAVFTSWKKCLRQSFLKSQTCGHVSVQNFAQFGQYCKICTTKVEKPNNFVILKWFFACFHTFFVTFQVFSKVKFFQNKKINFKNVWPEEGNIEEWKLIFQITVSRNGISIESQAWQSIWGSGGDWQSEENIKKIAKSK